MAVPGIGSHSAAARDVGVSPSALDARQDEGAPGTGGLHRLLNRPSALDRLAGDAGPLGKFRTDEPDRMPSGTAAFTLKASDALNRLAARLGLPSERILSGNPAMQPQQAPLPPAELPPGERPVRTNHGVSSAASRPVCAAEADNRTGPIDRGNRREVSA
jgi:hypothetical protein